jgi:hypothetical protein
MAGLDPAIDVFLVFGHLRDVDARHKAGHDGEEFESAQSTHTRFAPRHNARPIPTRHCERSEAIHSFFLLRHGLLRCARNDVDTAV